VGGEGVEARVAGAEAVDHGAIIPEDLIAVGVEQPPDRPAFAEIELDAQ
jgi:hypothetical protein